MTKYPAKLHIHKVLGHLQPRESSIIFLSGGNHQYKYKTDAELDFHQESNFYYVTGCAKPDFQYIYDNASSKSILIAPDIDPKSIKWHGEPESIAQMLDKYDVDAVVYGSEKERLISQLNPRLVYLLDAIPAGAERDRKFFEGREIASSGTLQKAFVKARMIKSEAEVELIEEASKISSKAHLELMRRARVGMNESELHALFKYSTYKQAAEFEAYRSIVASGENAAILHYGINRRPITNDADLVLVDAGCEFNSYASDITRTWPISGKFNGKSLEIYNIVLKMQLSAIELIKPDILYEDLHRLACNILTSELIKLGILINASEEQLKELNLQSLFFVHGLGHPIGLDVHDVHESSGDTDDPVIKNLRFRGPLKAGQVITVEPGCYFIDSILNEALSNDKTGMFLSKEKIDYYRDVGGVRIEDCVLVTNDGYKVLSAGAPKSPNDIELVMKQANES